MLIRALGVLATGVVLFACIDFLDGLACSSDADCIDYVCIDGACRRPGSLGPRDASPADAETHQSGATTLASGQLYPSRLLLMGDDVIWVNEAAMSMIQVRKLPKSGGASTLLANLGRYAYPNTAIVADGAVLYVVVPDKVVRLTMTGAQTIIAATNGSAHWGGGVGVDATNVFWLDTSPNGKVLRAPKAGGAAVEIATSQSSPNSLIVTSGEVIWATSTAVVGMATGASGPEWHFPETNPSSLISEGGIAYWISDRTTVVQYLPGTDSASSLSISGARLERVAAFGSDIYLGGELRLGANQIARTSFSQTTGAVTTLWSEATGGPDIVDVAVDSSHVYWIISSDTGRVLRIAR